MQSLSGWRRWMGLAAAIAAAALTRAAEPDSAPPAPRFSVAWMDRSVDPRVDFGQFAAGAWYRATEIPADRSSWGSFNQLDQRNRFLIRDLLEDAAAHPGPAGDLTQKVGDFYASAMDVGSD